MLSDWIEIELYSPVVLCMVAMHAFILLCIWCVVDSHQNVVQEKAILCAGLQAFVIYILDNVPDVDCKCIEFEAKKSHSSVAPCDLLQIFLFIK